MWVTQWPGGQEGFESEPAAEAFAARKLPELPSMNRYVVVYELLEESA